LTASILPLFTLLGSFLFLSAAASVGREAGKDGVYQLFLLAGRDEALWTAGRFCLERGGLEE